MKKLATIILLIAVLSLASGCTSQADYDRLITEYNDSVYQYNELLASHNDLIDDYNELTTQFEQYVEEVEEYSEQFEGAIVPPYLLVENREVNLVFHNLDGDLEYWNWKVEALEASVLRGYFMREMDISTLNYLGWHDIANRFTTDSKYVQLRGRRALDFRPYIMEDAFEPIASEFFARHPDDESKIREVWNMVTQLNKYSTEITETPRLPLETLLLGGGDCEDLAILTASILKAMPAEWDVSLVYMDGDNPTNINELNHVTVYVDTGRYKTFVESTQGEIMNPWEEVDGFYLEVQ